MSEFLSLAGVGCGDLDTRFLGETGCLSELQTADFRHSLDVQALINLIEIAQMVLRIETFIHLFRGEMLRYPRILTDQLAEIAIGLIPGTVSARLDDRIGIFATHTLTH